jgi:hypothetical protein
VSNPRTARTGTASVEYMALAGVIGLLLDRARSRPWSPPPPTRATESSARCWPGGSPALRAIRCPAAATRSRLLRLPARQARSIPGAAPRASSRRAPGRLPLLPTASCAAPGSRPGLTAAGRRVTEFVSIGGSAPRRRPRPPDVLALPPGSTAGSGSTEPDQEPDRIAASLRVAPRSGTDYLALVPLETLPGPGPLLTLPPRERLPLACERAQSALLAGTSLERPYWGSLTDRSMQAWHR